jgi:hypothetical protein
MASNLGLSGLVVLGFLAAAAVFLSLARVLARKPAIEIWIAAIALVAISSILLRVLDDRGLLLNRTPALLHAGFAALILVWATLRRDTSVLGAPAPSTFQSGAISWLAGIPGSGLLLSLPALWDLVVPQEVTALVQITLVGAAWLATLRRRNHRSATAKATAAPTPSVRLFISYRRDDSADVTGRLYDRLAARFGRDRVFKDVDSIPPGVDFRAYLQDMIGACDLVIAVIGGKWVSAGDEKSRRLDDPNDFVRIELETALLRRIPVVPVLVGGARMPSAGELPSTLGALVYRQGQALRPDPDFHRDVDRLIQGLEHHPLLVGKTSASTR